MEDYIDLTKPYHIALRDVYKALQLAQQVGREDMWLCRLASEGCEVIRKLEVKETPLPVSHAGLKADCRCPHCSLPVSPNEDVHYCGTCGQRLMW